MIPSCNASSGAGKPVPRYRASGLLTIMTSREVRIRLEVSHTHPFVMTVVVSLCRHLRTVGEVL